MALTSRYSAIDKAILIATGNTSALCGDTQDTEVNTASLVKADGTTTLDWTQAGSTASLSLLSNSTILYAELIWYSTVSSSYPNSTDVQAVPDLITFVTPAATITNLAPTYTEDYMAASGSIHRYRAAVVTDILKAAIVVANDGVYTVSHVPTSISTTDLCDTACGWTLAVVYRHDTFTPQRINFSSGIEFTNSANPIQTSVTGFTTPSTESDLKGYLFVACANGQPLIAGESLMAGTSFAYLNQLGNSVGIGNPKPGTKPNNPYNNIFAGQVNVCNPLSVSNGLLDTNGSHGDVNHNAFLPTQVNLGRNKWDMANLNLLAGLGTNKNQIAIQYTQDEVIPGTATPGVEWVALGSQVSAIAPNMIATLSGYDIDGDSQYNAEVGEIFTYALQIKNLGTTSATNVIISSILDTSVCTFIPNSIKVNGVQQLGATITTGVNIGTIAPTGVANVLYQVRITNKPTGGILSANVNYSYQFISGTGSPTFTNTASSNTVQVIVEQGMLSLTKTVSSPTAVVGDTLTYTTTITNTGTQSAQNVVFQDIVSDNYCTFVPHSVYIGGQQQYDYDPNNGFSLVNLAMGDAVVITFDVMVNTLTPDTKVYNTSYVTASYQYNQYVTPVKKTLASNVTVVQIQYYDVIGYRSNNNNYPLVGDVVTYTLTLTNIGNVSASNVYIQEPTINGATFVSGSVTIVPGPTPTGLNPFDGFYLPSAIAAQATTTVTYQVLVNQIQPDELIENIAQVPFRYQISPDSPIIQTEVDSNKVTTRSNFVVITMPETVDKSYATVSDVLYYSVNLTNTGNVDATNTVFSSAIQTDTSFVAGSVAINGVTQPNYNPNTGFSVGTIAPTDTVNVTYRARVTQVPATQTVYNQSQLTYDYLPNPNGQHITNTTFSNVVQTVINQASYTIVKSVDKAYAQLSDYLVYTSTIHNIGTVTLTNVSFIDNLPVYVQFVPQTVHIDGISYPDYDPNLGFNLADIHPTEYYTVVFGVQVISVPPTSEIINISHMTSTYQVNPNTPTITETTYSNPVVTQVLTGNVDVTKSVDKSYATINDTITYTIALSNTGNTSVSNVSLIDTIASCAHLKPNSVLVNGIQVSADPNTGIPIGTLNVGQVATVKFSIIVDTLPTPNVITNIATANYQYYWNPSEPIVNKTATSNAVTTVINIATSTLVKTVDKSYATVGDTLLYSVVATNTGTVPLTSVTFIDSLQSNITFVPNSVKINGVSKPGYLPYTGFDLADISVGGSQTVTFNVTVNSVPSTPPTPPQVNNNATINYQYKINPYTTSSTGTKTSETVTTYINQMVVTNTKTVDYTYATLDDILTYTSTITNSGNVTIKNTEFRDIVPTGTTFQTGTVTIDGNVTSFDPNIGFTLGDISPAQSVVVVFQVKVSSLPSTNQCDNTSNLLFYYQINPTQPAILGTVTSNTVTTYIRTGNLLITKSADRQEAMIGETIRYSFVLLNTGNTTLSSVTFRDPLQLQSSFVANSLYINDSQTSYDPTDTGFTLPFSIAPLQQVSIYFDVTVNQAPIAPATQYYLLNKAYIGYQYKINPSNPYIVVTNKESNQTSVIVKQMILITTKTVTPSPMAAIDDYLTYSITIHNAGSVPAEDVFFRDIVDLHTTFKPASVYVQVGSNSPINYPTANPNNGFYLPDPTKTLVDSNIIAVGETVIVTFQAQVNQLPENHIVYNTANLDYNFTISSTTYNISTVTNTTETYIAVGSLAVTKVVDKMYATVYNNLVYTTTITNTGTVDATSIKFRDPIPSDTAFVLSSIIVDGVTTSYTASDLVSGISLSNLKPSQSHVVAFTVNVTDLPLSGEVVNTSYADFSYQINTQTYNETKTSQPVTTYINLGKLTILKETNKLYATIGDIIQYTLTLTNSGNVPCSSIFLQDLIQSDATINPHSVYIDGIQQYNANPNVGFSVPDIAAGASSTVIFTVTVATVPSNYLLNNSATANYSYYINPTEPYITTSTTSNTVTTRINIGSLAVTKAVNLAYATLNDIIVYTITVVNNGNVNAVNVNFRDVIPTGLTFIPDSVLVNGEMKLGYDPYNSFTLGTIIPGGSSVVQFSSTVTSVPDPSLIVNKAVTTFTYRITPTGPDLYKEVDSNNVTTQINVAQLTTTKSVDLVYAKVGDVLTYSFVIQNTGNVNTTDIILTDGLQSDVSFNTGSVIINGGAPTTYNPATGIPVGVLAPNAQATVLFTVTVNPYPTHASVLNFGVSTFSYQINPSGNTYSKSSYSNTVSTIIVNPSMSSTKAVDLSYATLLDNLNYTIYVANTGNTTITNVFFKDYLSYGALFTTGSVILNNMSEPLLDPITGFDLPDILPGDVVSIQFAAQVTAVPSPDPQVTNYAISTGKYKISPTGPQYDISTTTNTVATIIHVGNVSATKTVDLEYANVGDMLTYTTVLTNTGNVNATTVTFFDTLQSQLAFIPGSVSIDGVIYDTYDPTVGFIIGTMSSAQSVTIEFEVSVITLPTPAYVENKSQVEFSYKINPSGSTITKTNFSNIVVTQIVLGQLTTTKAVDKGIATIGDELTYTIQIVNTGNVLAKNVMFYDTPSTGATFKSGSVVITNGTSSSTLPLDPTVGFNLNDIAVGNTVTVTFVATVVSVPPTNKVTNQAHETFEHYVNPKEPLVQKTSYSNTVTTNVALGSITVTKAVDKQFATIGEYLTYTVVVTNTGNIDVTNVTFVDPTPFNSQFVLHSVYVNGASQPTYYPALGFLIGTMTPGQIVTVVYQVQVIS